MTTLSQASENSHHCSQFGQEQEMGVCGFRGMSIPVPNYNRNSNRLQFGTLIDIIGIRRVLYEFQPGLPVVVRSSLLQ